MAKTITITLYSPKELWNKFCNWVFWPRRKECAQWCDFHDGVLYSMIVEILQNEVDDGAISNEVAERIGCFFERAIHTASKQTEELMCKPI